MHEQWVSPPERVSPIRVCIVDGQEMTRIGIRTFLQASGICHVVGEFHAIGLHATELVHLHPDVLIVNGEALVSREGLAGLARLCKALETQVLVLSREVGARDMQRLIELGVKGFASHGVSSQQLLLAIEHLMAGQSYVDLRLAGQLLSLVQHRKVSLESHPVLTPQEQRILPLVGEGLTNKEIASQLGLSDRTVKNYLYKMFKKLHITKRSQAAALYAQRGAMSQSLTRG